MSDDQQSSKRPLIRPRERFILFLLILLLLLLLLQRLGVDHVQRSEDTEIIDRPHD